MTAERDRGISLLDREVREDALRERTVHVAAPRIQIDRGTKSVLIFRIGMDWLGLPADVFQEVVEECAIHSLPHRRGGILSGLVNVRGELMLCVDLGKLLGLEPVPKLKGQGSRTEGEAANRARLRPHLLICNRDGDRLAFFVSEVFGIHRYGPENLRDAPATLARAAAGAYTVGMVPWKDRTVGCLNDDLVFYALNKALA